MAGVYRIGAERFLSLDGVPEVQKQQTELVVRPGVDGVALWLLGKRGTPFTLRSQSDESSFAAAINKRVDYAAMVGADPHQLVWSDHPLLSEGVQVYVLDVRPLVVRELLVSSGGLHAPSLGFIAAEWDLILV